MKNQIFNQVQLNDLPRNTFDLSHDKKLSCKMGYLIPILDVDMVPGDKISVKSSIFTRFAPLLAPIMHQVNVYCHYFFVPNRLVWDNWENFITGGEDGQDTSEHPYFSLDLTQETRGSLFDYLGVPVANDLTLTDDVKVNAIPFVAYQKIFNEYYRDQNLVAENTDTVIDGQNGKNSRCDLNRRAWQHDYFTSALPFTQKGDEALLPLTGEAPVFGYTDTNPPSWGTPTTAKVRDFTLRTVLQNVTNFQTATSGSLDAYIAGSPYDSYIDPSGNTYADLSQTNAVTSIIDLRRALALQEYLEKNARGGSRYIEWLKVHFNVVSSDARLQRPEYKGGYSVPIKISEVLQTSNNDTQDTPQGTMVGHGVGVGAGNYISHYAEEHGYFFGIMSVMPKSAYQQGMPKHLIREDRFDYYTPEFAHIGEQPIYNKELALFTGTDQDGIFGYTPRYAEYKFKNSSVHGDFKDSLDFWHLGRKFSSQPALNEDFIEMDYTEAQRIFAVQDSTDNLWCHVYNDVKMQRKMPVFGNPKL